MKNHRSVLISLAAIAAIVLQACSSDQGIEQAQTTSAPTTIDHSATASASATGTPSTDAGSASDDLVSPSVEPGSTPASVAKQGRAADPALVGSALDVAFGAGFADKVAKSDNGATFTWTMPERYDASWKAWQELRRVQVTTTLGIPPISKTVPHSEAIYGYQPSFVHPPQWTLTLDGCASTTADRTAIARWTWTIKLRGTVVGQHDEAKCKTQISVPEEGKYEVTLATRTASGRADSVTAVVDVEDIVVLSFGDSAASGEGNPDGLSSTGAEWVDRRCHRSGTSGHALTAKAMEARSAKSSVTFLSFACSGAGLREGILGSYAGQQPMPADENIPAELWQTVELVSQVAAAREALCTVPVQRCTASDMRKVDFVLVSIGANDVGFTSVLKVCAGFKLDPKDLVKFPTEIVLLRKILERPCNESSDIKGVLEAGLLSMNTDAEPTREETVSCDLSDAEWKQLLGYVPAEPPPFCFDGHNTFGELRRRLESAHLTPTRGVYLSTYPAELFSSNSGKVRGGCGIFDAINENESKFLTEYGQKLNELIQREAIKNGFYSVPGITEAFRHHGYCADPIVGDQPPGKPGSETYFVALNESLRNQLGLDGTVHPNRRGHEAIRDAFFAAIAAPKPDRRATHKATITVTGIRFDGVPKFATNSAEIEFWLNTFESTGRNDFDNGTGQQSVAWKQAVASVKSAVTPGQWQSPSAPVKLEVVLAPSDMKLGLRTFATMRSNNNVTAIARPQITRPGAPLDPPVQGGEGGYNSYIADFFADRGGDAISYGAGTHRVVSKVTPNTTSTMTIEFCIAISPLRSVGETATPSCATQPPRA